MPSMRKTRNASKILFNKTQWKSPHDRLSRSWKDNIKINLREIRYEFGTRFNWHKIENRIAVISEHGNKYSCFLKIGTY
jgi:hypothetical protein